VGFWLRRREDPLERVNLLTVAPVRLAAWEEKEERVVILRPSPATRGFRGALDRVLTKLSTPRIRLDEVGSHAWLLFDGTRTVADVATSLREHFGDRVEPVESRLGQLVRSMHREGFLAYPEPDRLAAED